MIVSVRNAQDRDQSFPKQRLFGCVVHILITTRSFRVTAGELKIAHAQAVPFKVDTPSGISQLAVEVVFLAFKCTH